MYGSEQRTVTEEIIKRKETVKNAFCQDNLRINKGWLEFNKCVAEEMGIVDLNAIKTVYGTARSVRKNIFSVTM